MRQGNQWFLSCLFHVCKAWSVWCLSLCLGCWKFKVDIPDNMIKKWSKFSSAKGGWGGHKSLISKLTSWRIHETPILAWQCEQVAFKSEIKGPVEAMMILMDISKQWWYYFRLRKCGQRSGSWKLMAHRDIKPVCLVWQGFKFCVATMRIISRWVFCCVLGRPVLSWRNAEHWSWDWGSVVNNDDSNRQMEPVVRLVQTERSW